MKCRKEDSSIASATEQYARDALHRHSGGITQGELNSHRHWGVCTAPGEGAPVPESARHSRYGPVSLGKAHADQINGRLPGDRKHDLKGRSEGPYKMNEAQKAREHKERTKDELHCADRTRQRVRGKSGIDTVEYVPDRGAAFCKINVNGMPGEKIKSMEVTRLDRDRGIPGEIARRPGKSRIRMGKEKFSAWSCWALFFLSTHVLKVLAQGKTNPFKILICFFCARCL